MSAEQGDNRLPMLAGEIREAVGDARRHAGSAIGAAISAGEKLIEAKALLKHGTWLPWLAEHCELSERQAQRYMRLALHKGKLDVKSDTVSDLTIRGALEALSEPRLFNFVPPSGHVMIGTQSLAEISHTILVVPSYQHPAHFYVTHVSMTPDGGSVVGTRRPLVAGYVEAMVLAVIATVGSDAFEWQTLESAPWTFNEVLFFDAKSYVDSLQLNVPEDRAEIVQLAQTSEPPIEFGVMVKAQIKSGVAQ